MAGKKTGAPISIRVEPELADAFNRFPEAQRGWTKVEAAAVALHAFLFASDEERERALVAYRRWLKKSAPEPPKRGRK